MVKMNKNQKFTFFLDTIIKTNKNVNDTLLNDTMFSIRIYKI